MAQGQESTKTGGRHYTISHKQAGDVSVLSIPPLGTTHCEYDDILFDDALRTTESRKPMDGQPYKRPGD